MAYSEDSEWRNRKLACMASIVIDNACELLRVQHPNVPIRTIHDSIFTNPEYTDLVTGILRAAFNRRGIDPRIERKDSSSPP